MAGYVYLFREGPLHKIGHSASPNRRLFEVAGETATIVHTIHSARPFAVEQCLHRRFAAQRVRDEWFSLAAADVALICSLGQVDAPDELPANLFAPLPQAAPVRADLMEMMREICFSSRDNRGKRIKITQLIDGFLRPIVLREHREFKKRQSEKPAD